MVLELAVDIQHQLSISIQGEEEREKEQKKSGNQTKSNAGSMFPGANYGTTSGFGSGKKTAEVKGEKTHSRYGPHLQYF